MLSEMKMHKRKHQLVGFAVKGLSTKLEKTKLSVMKI